eukprot:6044101-Amphidinium_carterae.1
MRTSAHSVNQCKRSEDATQLFGGFSGDAGEEDAVPNESCSAIRQAFVFVEVNIVRLAEQNGHRQRGIRGGVKCTLL